jgi:hypothetical protein
MLWNASNLKGYSIDAVDGEIGSIADFLFDDRHWVVRWLVVNTGAIFGREVLLPPSAASAPDAGRRVFPMNVTKQQVKESPEIGRDAPVSRQRESAIFGHYGWEPYWLGYPYAPAAGLAAPLPPGVPRDGPAGGERSGDPNLRSVGEVTGYYIEAQDGDVGHIEDFLIDSDDWTIRYAVIDTRNWWPGKMVIVPPAAFSHISWSEKAASIELTRERIQNGPEYDPMQTVDRAYEERYHDYFGYPPYWGV